MILLKQKEGKRHDKTLIGGLNLLLKSTLLMQSACVNIDELLRNLPVFNHSMKYPVMNTSFCRLSESTARFFK